MKLPVRTLKLPIRQGRTYESRLYREQSPLKMRAIPIASVMLASMATTLPLIESEPLLPPLGFMMLLAWRMMRPGLWPVWMGLPLGLFDDIFSGQPFGSAGLIWSLTMLAMELIDTRASWRDYWQDWIIAALMIAAAIILGWKIAGLVHPIPAITVLFPQMLLSVLLFPLVVRLCSWLDRLRLAT